MLADLYVDVSASLVNTHINLKGDNLALELGSIELGDGLLHLVSGSELDSALTLSVSRHVGVRNVDVGGSAKVLEILPGDTGSQAGDVDSENVLLSVTASIVTIVSVPVGSGLSHLDGVGVGAEERLAVEGLAINVVLGPDGVVQTVKLDEAVVFDQLDLLDGAMGAEQVFDLLFVGLC